MGGALTKEFRRNDVEKAVMKNWSQVKASQESERLHYRASVH